MKWITGKNIKVERVACPWLIKQFVDPQAEFLFVEEKDFARTGPTGFADPRKVEALECCLDTSPSEQDK